MITSILAEISTRYNLKRKAGSGRLVGPCPKCGGSSRSDKFVMQEDGGFKCYGCPFKGDIITWLREMDGKSCAEAHEATGMPCRSTACQVRGTCRMGDGSGARPAKVSRSVQPAQQEKEAGLPISAEKSPAESWRIWAEEMVVKAAWRLQQHPEVLSWLAERGISAEAAVVNRLGWLGHNQKVPRYQIGLAPRDGKDTLWIPDGLVIPIYDAAGVIHRLRIRRPDLSREKFLPDLKYVWIEGSGNVPLTIRPQLRTRGTVIVEAELDAMAVAAAHPAVRVIALGTVSAGLPQSLRDEIADTATILVALDADQGKDGKRGPGPAAIAVWLKEWRQARFWPVPAGKDPGDYAKDGGDLRSWIESGLVPEIPASSSHDSAIMPGVLQTGDGGEYIPGEPDEIAEEVQYRIVTLLDGRELHVTNDEAFWHELTASGKIAFSENELKRLQVACGAMTDEERAQAALQAVAVKEAFSGAYIKRGEMMA